MNHARDLLLQATLATVYAVVGAVCLMLAFAHPNASPVWAPTGIALAAGLILGARAWPAIFVGAFIVNVRTEGTILTSLGIALGNTLEAVIGTYLVTRWARGRAAFDRSRSAFAFVALAGGVGPLVAATIGVSSLSLGGFVAPAEWWAVWFTWWLGDAVGALTVAPALLLWIQQPRLEFGVPKMFEALGLILLVVTAGAMIFLGSVPLPVTRAPSEFMTMPVLMWAAYRFGPRGAITAVIVLCVIAIVGTLDGHGPFVARTPNTSLLLLQSYIGVAAATTLVIAASIAQRRRAERQLREWSTTDPLTGLANYRQLTTVLDREIQRSQRTGRAFALLLLDLDHLKVINDRDGHLVGSRALCRVAEVLRGASRAVDTTARYGGDEFAIVLPESGEEEAQKLAERIGEQLARDEDWPPISVSIGLAVFPRDAEKVETLIDSADRRMYGAKRRRSGGQPNTAITSPV
jgi:diguanylate cyclase (GGDEF)-like protein